MNYRFGGRGPHSSRFSQKNQQQQNTEFTPGVRQNIVGTLTLQGKDKEPVADLAPSYVDRILKSLEVVYQNGKTSQSKMLIDYRDGELLLSFPFDKTLVERMKGLDRNERAWDPELKSWRVFVGIFDDVIDILGKGVRITDAAYKAICDFVPTKYYAFIAKGKLGKIIVRESWYGEKNISQLPKVGAAPGSNASSVEEAQNDVLEKVMACLKTHVFKRKPFAHQLQGIQYLLANNEAALLDEMGCGKSFQIANAIDVMMASGDIERALIAAPMSLIRTWQDELRRAVDVEFNVVAGTPSQRAKALQSKAPLFLIHYEGLRLEEEALAAWVGAKPAAFILDESQRVKNLQAQTTQSALKIRQGAKRCIISTGTPIANRPLDLFAQYLVMDRGRTFGTQFASFKDVFCEIEIQKIPVGRKTIRVERFLGTRNVEELKDRIARTSLRRLKSEVLDLPPVLYKDYVVDLKSDQKTMYAQMRDTLKLEVSQMSATQVSSEASTIMVKLLRLSQICSNPRLLVNDYEGPNAKFSELEDLLEDIFADETKKVILWSHFVENVNWLVEKFAEKYGAVGHTGEMSIESRQTSIEDFRKNVSCRLFVATPQSAKEGLTLLPEDGKTRADTMIYYDFSFDSASYVQSQARFHRIGQAAEKCFVIHLVGDSTIDEYIRKKVIEKVHTAAKILDEDESSKLEATRIISGKFSKDEILDVLS